MNNFGYVFAILFVTLGPLKTIPVFYMITHGADASYRRTLAFRAFIVATALVFFIAFSASGTLAKWHVSIDALMIAGGIILFVSALKSILGFELVSLPTHSEEPPAAAPAPALGWMSKPVLQPLVIPTIVTPAAVVAILFFLAQASGDPNFYRTVLLILALMLVLNYVGMVLAGQVMRLVGLPILQVVGWIFAVLQAGLAVEAILGALRRLQIVP